MSGDVQAGEAAPLAISGVLVIDKPVGPTSMDVCRRVRTALRRNKLPKGLKVGHGGTLDPLASGVVVVLVGKATRLCEQVMAGTKVYEAEVDLAHVSESHDMEREPTPVEVASPPTRAALEAACAAWTGSVEQLPPVHSAVWVNGQRAYALARAGQEAKVQPRQVRIDAIEVLDYAWPIARLRITCGKGTYIRSLARDLGAAMGAGGMLRALRRTRVGSFTVEQGLKLDELPTVLPLETLLPPEV